MQEGEIIPAPNTPDQYREAQSGIQWSAIAGLDPRHMKIFYEWQAANARKIFLYIPKHEEPPPPMDEG